MRRFELHRIEDKTGISGTGRIAEGVLFSDGRCVMRWLTQYRSMGVYDSIQDLEAIHGHGGTTKFVFIDFDRLSDPRVSGEKLGVGVVNPRGIKSE